MSEGKEIAAKTVYTVVTMTDGRQVSFPGKTQMLKDYEEPKAGDTAVTVRFDFVNGETRSHKIELEDPLLFKYVAHGASQKIGDKSATAESVEDMVIRTEDQIEHLGKGEWSLPRAAGDGFNGAHVVIRAIMEVKGLSQEYVKEFLARTLEAGKNNTPPLTRQALYNAFRANGTRTAPVIERLEKEGKTRIPAIDAEAALGMMGN
jgi:hypothetical protein